MAFSVSRPRATKRRIVGSCWLWRLIAICVWASLIAELLGCKCVNWALGQVSPQLPGFEGLVLLVFAVGVWWLIGTLRTVGVAIYPLVLLAYDAPRLAKRNWVPTLLKVARNNWVAILLLAPYSNWNHQAAEKPGVVPPGRYHVWSSNCGE